MPDTRPASDDESRPGLDEAGASFDYLLGGAIRILQPRDGYRVSMDTVMLAATVPAKAGERVIEGGVGTGGASLCLARRVPGVTVDGVELQDEMLAFASRNIELNGLGGQVRVRKGCITDLSGPEGVYDHAMVNPPYLAAGKAIRSPETNKGLANMELTGSLKDWIRFCLHHVKPKGTISIVYRADRMDEVIALLHRQAGDLTIFPMWSKAGIPAKRVIIQARKGTRGVAHLLPGMVMHGADGLNTPEAESILRQMQPLDLKAFAKGRQSG